MFIPDAEYTTILGKLPILCVDLLIVFNNQCLLVKRNNEPAKGHFWFPGGRVNRLELIKDASIRKAKEETNLDCEYIEIVSVEETIFREVDPIIHTINICCLMQCQSISAMQIDKFHDEYKWVEHQSDDYHPAVNHPLSLLNM